MFNFCREKGPETVPLKTIDNVKKVLQTNYDSPTSFLQVKVFIFHVIQDQAKVVTGFTKEMKLTLTKLEKKATNGKEATDSFACPGRNII